MAGADSTNVFRGFQCWRAERLLAVEPGTKRLRHELAVGLETERERVRARESRRDAFSYVGCVGWLLWVVVYGHGEKLGRGDAVAERPHERVVVQRVAEDQDALRP
jgi:hypothetical protein